MKKVILLSIAFLLFGCNTIVDIEGQQDDCLLILDMGGEITTTDVPLTKSSSQDIYLLQIYKGSSPYASGIFDNVDDMTVYLKKGYTYNIVVSLLKNGKNKLGIHYSAVNNSVSVETIATMTSTGQIVKKEWGASAFSTFAWNQEYAVDELWLAINKIFYNDYIINGVRKNLKGIFYYADKNSTELLEKDLERSFKLVNKTYTNSVQPEFANIGYANLYQYSSGGYNNCTQCYDWLYGKASITADGTMVTKTIELKRMGFKLQCDPVTGITDGSVNIKITRPVSNQTILNETFTAETITSVGPYFYAFPNLDEIWENADGYEENFQLSVQWTRGIGVTQSFGSINIKMKRNMLNRVSVSVGTNDKDAGMNIIVESDDSELEIINKEL